MRRRQLLALAAGASMSWPELTQAQQTATHRSVGVLGAATPTATSSWMAAFVKRMSELGWNEGRNLTLHYRWAEGRNEPLPELAAELVRLKVDVILTHATAPVVAAKQATSIVPIVFANAGDPVANSLVASLARPDGNVTGLSIQGTDTVGKRLELLREIAPRQRRLASWAMGETRPS